MCSRVSFTLENRCHCVVVSYEEESRCRSFRTPEGAFTTYQGFIEHYCAQIGEQTPEDGALFEAGFNDYLWRQIIAGLIDETLVGEEYCNVDLHIPPEFCALPLHVAGNEANILSHYGSRYVLSPLIGEAVLPLDLAGRRRAIVALSFEGAGNEREQFAFLERAGWAIDACFNNKMDVQLVVGDVDHLLALVACWDRVTCKRPSLRPTCLEDGLEDPELLLIDNLTVEDIFEVEFFQYSGHVELINHTPHLWIGSLPIHPREFQGYKGRHRLRFVDLGSCYTGIFGAPDEFLLQGFLRDGTDVLASQFRHHWSLSEAAGFAPRWQAFYDELVEGGCLQRKLWDSECSTVTEDGCYQPSGLALLSTKGRGSYFLD